ncbi:hypothetical protein CJ030_MR2G022340 [Morella rubra]|uniref:non-specific serine/threonine protein kinase n=1 Tax=Morella rubra TaxID=262757 RepID=A0A6A1WGS5_9ROSI|nr:hypothetical protein CJ030_MR2G022340 [Morella rubra]
MGNITAPYYHYVYALVECTPYLDELECRNCLARIVSYIPQCCDGKRGGKYVTPSCDIRYETYVFTDPAAEAPQPSQFDVTDPPLPPTEGKKTNIKVIVIISVIIGTLFMAISTLLLWRWLAKRKGETNQKIPGENEVGDKISQVELPELPVFSLEELPVFSLEELASATNNFHESNKLGQGGFGPVYRGKLLDGQEIAAKRLARSSGQGLQGFMNEVVVISRLQHRNLVRLLGCCVDGEEKMLVYEYMPNKNPVQQKLLNWRKRSNIMEGIGRGLLYLHRDSRLRIIHRDLKPSNILLDGQLNPKISDFGMAKIFGGDEDQANTKRVVGTYGYMSPEYAMEGRFSEKSDVFSFGVVLLEIISGRRNTSFYYDEDAMSLLGFAWKMWNAGNIVAVVDPMLMCEPCSESEILRCIQVALLCVQEFAEDRPTVSVVISMLKSEIVDLPHPKQAAFTARKTAPGRDSSQGSQRICSINNVTVTVVDGR